MAQRTSRHNFDTAWLSCLARGRDNVERTAVKMSEH